MGAEAEIIIQQSIIPALDVQYHRSRTNTNLQEIGDFVPYDHPILPSGSDTSLSPQVSWVPIFAVTDPYLLVFNLIVFLVLSSSWVC